MARVYLDTSFISACVTTRTDAASIYRRETSTEWMRTQSPIHELYISAEVINELDDPAYPQREVALALVSAIPLLSIDS